MPSSSSCAPSAPRRGAPGAVLPDPSGTSGRAICAGARTRSRAARSRPARARSSSLASGAARGGGTRMSPPSSSGPWRRRSPPRDEMSERILDAALELVAASGLRNLTMDEAAVAGGRGADDRLPALRRPRGPDRRAGGARGAPLPGRARPRRRPDPSRRGRHRQRLRRQPAADPLAPGARPVLPTRAGGRAHCAERRRRRDPRHGPAFVAPGWWTPRPAATWPPASTHLTPPSSSFASASHSCSCPRARSRSTIQRLTAREVEDLIAPILGGG